MKKKRRPKGEYVVNLRTGDSRHVMTVKSAELREGMWNFWGAKEELLASFPIDEVFEIMSFSDAVRRG